MPNGRFDIRSGGILLALAVSALLFAACSETPTAPEYTNPFDPDAPDYDGNPLGLTANYTASTGNISLLWTHPSGFGITSYEVRHATESQGPFAVIATVDAPPAGNIANYSFAEPARNAANYFLVVGTDNAGNSMAASLLTAVPRVTPPLLSFARSPGSATIASRFARLTVATSRGDSAILADNIDFAGPNRAVRIVQPGAVDTVDWDFGPRNQDDTLTVYLKVITGGLSSLIASVTRAVLFAPVFNVEGIPATVASNLVDLTVDTVGVQRMRFALAEDELTSQPWEDPVELRPGFVLGDALQPQTIYGQFEGNFGVDTVSSKVVTPDDLSGATFSITGLGADRITEDSTLDLACGAVATQMRFAASADFAGNDWIPYADSYAIDVGAGAGERVLYGQFRNHWIQSAVLTDWYIQVGQPLEVAFLAPADSAVLRGGGQLLTRGIARATVDGQEIDRVELFFAGASDWVQTAGTTDWQYLWSIPRYTEDTWLNIRARVITVEGESTAADTASASVAVLVTQLVVTITEPISDSEITGGSAVTIGGTAQPAADGAAMDSVVVIVGEERLTATETEAWSVNWLAPEVTETTALNITATLFAGSESVSDTVSVVVLPSG